MLRFVAERTSRCVCVYVCLSLPPLLALALLSPFRVNLHHVALPLSFARVRIYTELARRSATHARTYITLRTHDLATVCVPFALPRSRYTRAGRRVARTKKRVRIPRSTSAAAAATRAVHATIGALRWPSLECVRAARTELPKSDRTRPPRPVPLLRPRLRPAPFAEPKRRRVFAPSVRDPPRLRATEILRSHARFLFFFFIQIRSPQLRHVAPPALRNETGVYI